MPRPLRLLVVTLFLLTVGALPASAQTEITWTAHSGKSLELGTSGDVVASGTKAFTRSWSRSVWQWPTSAGSEWDARISVTSSIADLTANPPVPTTALPAGTRYDWTGKTGNGVYFRSATPETGDLGWSADRQLIGGRDLPAGATTRSIVFGVTNGANAIRQMNVGAIFSWGGTGWPVAVTSWSCDRAPTWLMAEAQPAWAVGVEANTRLEIRCELTLTSSSPSRYMPQFWFNEFGGSDGATLPSGATTFTTTDDLGTTEFGVTPAAGDVVYGRYDRQLNKIVQLDFENRVAEFDSWYAQHTKIFELYTNGDTITAGPQQLRPWWRFGIQGPYSTPWDAALRVTSAIPPSELSWWPAMAYDPATRTYSRVGRTSDMYTSVSRNGVTEIAELGFTGVRTIDSRDVPPGPDVVRTVHVTATATAPARSLFIGVSFYPNPGDVVAVVASDCPGATGDSTWKQWWVNDVAPGATIEGTCTLTLRNTGTVPARFMPFVNLHVTRGIQRADILGATSFTASDDLGTAVLEVTPPSGTTPFGHLDQSEERTAILRSENRTAVQDWTATLVRETSTGTRDDAITDDVLVSHSWHMAVQSWSGPWSSDPARFPAHIQVVAPAELWTNPIVTPTIGAAGYAYRWDGETPVLYADAAPLGAPTRGSIGFTATRGLSGGRLVPAHTTSTRTFTVSARTTAAMTSLNVIVSLGVIAMPGTPPLPLAVGDVVCPGSVQQGGGPGGTWRLNTPPVGTAATFQCTFTLANSGDLDALYMPAVFISSEQSATTAPAVLGASSLHLDESGFGAIDFSVEPPVGLTPSATLVVSARTSGFFSSEARIVPHPTTLEISVPPSTTFGSVPSAEIRLSDAKTGSPIANARVEVTIVETGLTLSELTGADGIAHVALPSLMLPGTYTLSAWYTGNASFEPSSARRSFEIVNSAGHVVGSFRFANGGRGDIAVRSTGATIGGDFHFWDGTVDFRASEIRAFGLSSDGTRAYIVMRDAGGVTALLIALDRGEPSRSVTATPTPAPSVTPSPGPSAAPPSALTPDRLWLRIAGVEQNPLGTLAEGNLEVLP